MNLLACLNTVCLDANDVNVTRKTEFRMLLSRSFGSRKSSLAQIDGVPSDACFRRVIPAESFSRLMVDKYTCLLLLYIQIAVVTMRNYWIDVLLSVYCYTNNLCNSIKCMQSMVTEIITICIKRQEIIQVDFSNI
jgi:hypothetical protein